MLELNKISFFYKTKQALSDVSFSLNLDKKCVSLVGHNGAGKSTLLNIICGILKSYEGTMVYTDDVKIAYLPFDNPIYDQFTVKENMLFWFQLYNNKKFDINHQDVQELIHDFKIDDLIDKKVYMLSSGEKRKTALACILLGNADLIVLDEPFNGLDISSVSELCNIITCYQEKGKSFIISSHQLDILNKISNQTLILKEGELVLNSENNADNEAIIDTYLKLYES